MMQTLVMESAKKLNYFPPKGGISSYYSPCMILHQQDLDYKKDCAYEFCEYVQAHNNIPMTTIHLHVAH